MRKISILLVLVLLAFSGCKAVKTSDKITEVQVLSTVHKLHLSNPNYPYQKVTEVIKKFDPDIIGIEIRPEDIKEDSAYLAQFYPQEMRQVLKDFPIEKVRGFDWYGEEMRSRKMPADVFKNELTELGQIKKLQSEMNRDSLLAPKFAPLAELGNKQVALAKANSPAELNNGDYDKITADYYHVLYSALAGTKYEKFSKFNHQRDLEISKNIVKLVEENPGKRLIFLVGANHRGPVVSALQNKLGNRIKMVPVLE